MNEYPLECELCHREIEHIGNFESQGRKTLNCILMSVIMQVSNKKTITSPLFAFYVKKAPKISISIKYILQKSTLI